MDKLNARELEHIHNPYVGTRVRVLEETGSTNDDGKAMAKAGAPSGTIIIAANQTQGKGRLGRSWTAERDAAIAMSIILRPSLLPEQAQMLTLLAGLSVTRVIETQTELNAGIKWPNDVVVNGKKVCGILTETGFAGKELAYGVVGIGINVNTGGFQGELENKATSLKLESGQAFCRTRLITALITDLDEAYGLFMDNPGYFIEAYKKRCVNLGNPVMVHDPLGAYAAQAVDISPGGELVVEKENGETAPIAVGEVSIRGIMGYL